MRRLFQWGLLGIVLLFVGACNATTDESASKPAAKDITKNITKETEEEHGHSHEGDDELVWPREGLEHNGYTLNLGHHGVRVHAGHDVEPAVSIQRDGADVEDAEVFISLVSVEDENQTLVEEVATVYEPKTDSEPAHYAQGKLSVPEGTKRVIIRYRIKFPQESSEQTFDVAVTVD